MPRTYTRAMPAETTLAATLAEDAAERFLRYVRIDTRSDEESDTYPSTDGQLDLLRLLRDELEQVGLADVAMDEHGYVTGTLPATVGARGSDHRAVRPRRHRARGERRRRLAAARALRRRRDRARGLGPGDPARRVARALQHVGHELITTDGTTLLGADDKAGIAEIMAAVTHLVAHPEIPHGTVKVAFNPDEEVGRGVDPLPGRELRRRGRLHRRRLDDGRAAVRDVLRRAGAACASAAARSIPAGPRASS